MNYERPSKGNRYEITINQHFHSAHSISLFYNKNNKVEVCDKITSKICELRKDAKKFITKRNWDERAERGYMADIERSFHKEIDCFSYRYFNRDHNAISKYYILWKLRYEAHLNRNSNLNTKEMGISGEDLTKEKQDWLEKKHIGFVRSNGECGEYPARQLTGIEIQAGIMQYIDIYKDVKWGLLEAERGEFLCADTYQDILFMPISPKFAFAANVSDCIISYDNVALANRRSIVSAQNFYFAKHLKNCPI